MAPNSKTEGARAWYLLLAKLSCHVKNRKNGRVVLPTHSRSFYFRQGMHSGYDIFETALAQNPAPRGSEGADPQAGAMTASGRGPAVHKQAGRILNSLRRA